MKRALFLLHLPPPIHGSSVVGKYIFDSKKINSSLKIKYLNLLLSRKIEHTGKISFIKIFRFIQIWFRLVFLLLSNKFDICYFALSVNGMAFFKDAIIAITLKFFRIKVVYHLHNKGAVLNKKSKLYYFLYKQVFANSEVILLSDLLYYDIDEFVAKGATHVCYNGIEEIIHREDLIINKQNEIPVILFFGNLIEAKGISVLLEACSILKERRIGYVCNFVGGEADVTIKDFKRKKKELDLTENVHYLGKKYGKEKVQTLLNADILAFPTYYDCFPLVLLEALQFSLPIVTTFEGGVPDIVIDGEIGFLAPQRDAVALADKLEILIRNPELRKQMGEAGRKKYEEEFTLERFENRMVEILKSVISS